MTTSRSLRASLVVLIAAWLMVVPAFYLLYDFWLRGLDAAVAPGELLRPYAFFVGVCPLMLFWAGSLFAAWGGGHAARRASGASRALGLLVLLLGAVGGLAGTAVGVPLLAVLALGLGRGDVPLGLLLLLGGLSAAGIWLLRAVLRRWGAYGAA
jgi:hypothetical protein